ncbi:alpha-amylase family protein [Flagellimonas sp. HMM57]|uniref:alpha-amylase family glycosyl hydrolase n=1 Tax=unclassified Flagellimonas TaxID=2644544 RepID=UPI0013D8DB22|nr:MULTISPECIES: alpha-amylase family glycosyl hydrolase [unclassified Flagellimonas]UII74628.1 alpha-amylase family protein [Flagellimonas sp. HMM57]
MKRYLYLPILMVLVSIHSCEQKTEKKTVEKKMKKKAVVYQVFTRLFGNTNTTNNPWGTIEENGIGKFADFTEEALKEIKDLGVTHIWYTGVPHHAVINDYTDYGISNDDPDVVKGRAGSPYAVKDYYNVNPDLAIDPSKRLEEFEALIERTHKVGMKVLIDIVPNHVARNYEGLTNPEGVSDFGSNDDTSLEYHINNNFYYIPDLSFTVPQWQDGYLPLGGSQNKLADGAFKERPAKWTGNGSRLAQPHFNDWYETVKVNYGVRPDGTKDFDELSEDFSNKDYKAHLEFWKDKTVPDSWDKFKDITLYWLDLGVDGFRFDMAEMVPVEFWSYLNSNIKTKNPDAFLLAEVYNPQLYRDYIHKGKMDYLYDKVELYDSIKHIMKGYGWTDHIPVVQKGMADIEHHMLHFLENHDEQRIASPDFVGRAEIAKPAMVVSATLSTSPTMIYFGQEVGEPGAEDAGFGKPTRTSIFDYIGVPHHQRWMNNKKFDGGQLSEEEKTLRDFYKRLLNFTINSEALMGRYQEIHFYNKDNTENYDHRVLSYVRWSENEKLVIVSNFDSDKSYTFDLKLPQDIISKWNLSEGGHSLVEELYGKKNIELNVKDGIGVVAIELQPLESIILSVAQ